MTIKEILIKLTVVVLGTYWFWEYTKDLGFMKKLFKKDSNSIEIKLSAEEAYEFLVTGIREEREEKVYQEFFPNKPNKIMTRKVDPTFNHWGVFEIPPSDKMPYWTYITSGMSNPRIDIDEQEDVSGYGFELVMHSQEKSPEIFLILFDLMDIVVEENLTLGNGHTIKSTKSNFLAMFPESSIEALLFSYPTNLPKSFHLISGKVELLHVDGITQDEYEAVKGKSKDKLITFLRKQPHYPCFDPYRKSTFKG